MDISSRNGMDFSGVRKILENLYDFSEVDQECFAIVAQSSEPVRIDDLKEMVGKDRSTVYRAVQRLVENGFVSKEKIDFDRGGYCHVYRCRETEDLVSEMRSELEDFHSELDRSIEKFEQRTGS